MSAYSRQRRSTQLDAMSLPSSVTATAPTAFNSAISVISAPARPLVAAAAGQILMQAVSRARRFTNSTIPPLSIGGSVFGIVTTDVNPPRAAARLPVAMVSFDSKPGSRKCTWMSTRPGHTMQPVASSTSLPRRSVPMRAMRSPMISRLPGIVLSF